MWPALGTGEQPGAGDGGRYQGQPPLPPPPGAAVFGGVRGSGATLIGARVTSMRGFSVCGGALRGHGVYRPPPPAGGLVCSAGGGGAGAGGGGGAMAVGGAVVLGVGATLVALGRVGGAGLGAFWSSAAGVRSVRTRAVMPVATAAVRAMAAAGVRNHGGRCSRAGLHAPMERPSTPRIGAGAGGGASALSQLASWVSSSHQFVSSSRGAVARTGPICGVVLWWVRRGV